MFVTLTLPTNSAAQTHLKQRLEEGLVFIYSFLSFSSINELSSLRDHS